MFTRIVWATDGSPTADQALAHAVAIAVRDGAELHIVHVAEKLVGSKAAGLDVFANEDELRAKALRQAHAAHDGSDLVCLVHIVPGRMTRVAERIHELADGIGADLIVVGTRGHGPLGALVLGSVTQELLHLSSCPVLAVPPVAVAADGTQITRWPRSAGRRDPLPGPSGVLRGSSR